MWETTEQPFNFPGKIWKHWFPEFMTGNPREVWARSSEAYRCAETCNSLLYAIYSSRLIRWRYHSSDRYNIFVPALIILSIISNEYFVSWFFFIFTNKVYFFHRSKYQPISVIVPPSNQDKYTSSNSLTDEELYSSMEENVDVEVTTKEGKSLNSRDVLDFVKVHLGVEKTTNNYDMFIYLDGIRNLTFLLNAFEYTILSKEKKTSMKKKGLKK